MSQEKIYCWHLITEDTPLESEIVFREICEQGEIIPYELLQERMMSNPKVTLVDRLAGDGKYVFLGLATYEANEIIEPDKETYYPGLEKQYGFGFDVFELIKAGALVGPHDLLRNYDQLLEGLLFEKGIQEANYRNTSAETLALLEYYGLWDEAVDLLTDFAASQRLKSRGAKSYIRQVFYECVELNYDCLDYKSAEILYPGALDLSKFCKFTIQDGHIMPCCTL